MAGLPDEISRRVRVAHLVDVALEGDPGRRIPRRGREHHTLDRRRCTALCEFGLVVEAAAPARLPREGKIRTEAKAQSPGEGAFRRLHRGRVGQRRAGRIADQDRRQIILEFESPLDGVRQVFEIDGKIAAVLRLRADVLQIAADVDAHDDGVHGHQMPGHVDHAAVPAAVAGNEQRDAGGAGGWLVDRDRAKRVMVESDLAGNDGRRGGTRGAGRRSLVRACRAARHGSVRGVRRAGYRERRQQRDGRRGRQRGACKHRSRLPAAHRKILQ